MARLRDNQRARLYHAESVLDAKGGPEPHLTTVPQIEKWIAKLMKKPWFKRNFYVAEVIIRPGRGARNASCLRFGPIAELTLPRWARTEGVILHELAHGIVPARVALHGPEFAGTFIYLVEKVMGKDKADLLRDSFREGNVDWTSAHIKHP